MKAKATMIFCGNRLVLVSLTVIIFILQLAACSSHKQMMKNDLSNDNTISSGKQDGLSYNTAVIIKKKSERLGIKTEYAWIKEHYPNYKFKKQALVRHNKRPYDIITITLPEEKDLDLYFDISNFFGNW